MKIALMVIKGILLGMLFGYFAQEFGDVFMVAAFIVGFYIGATTKWTGDNWTIRDIMMMNEKDNAKRATYFQNKDILDEIKKEK